MNVENRWNVDSWNALRGFLGISPKEEPTLQRLASPTSSSCPSSLGATSALCHKGRRARLDLDADGDKVVIRRFCWRIGPAYLGTVDRPWSGLINLPQVDGIHRPTVTVPLSIHIIIKAGRFRTVRRTDQRTMTKPTINLSPQDRYQMPRKFYTPTSRSHNRCGLVTRVSKLRRRRMSLNGPFVRATSATRAGDRTGHGSV